MDLSSPKLRKILVGVAILVVVIFIVIRFFRRSYYSYPNTSEEGSFTITAVPTFSAGVATFTTTAAHGFSAGDLVYISGVTGLIYTDVVTGYPPGAGTPAPAGGSAVYLASATGTSFTVKAMKSVASVTINAGGSAYTNASTVTFGQPPAGGIQATGTTVASGAVTSVTITNAGSYLSSPTVTFGAPGSGAVGTAVLTATTVSSAAVKSIVQPAMDKMENTDLLGCQTQYATDLISATSTLTGSSSQTINNSSARTVNVTSSSGFVVGDKVVIPGVVDSAGKTSVLIVDSVPSTTSITFTAGSLPQSATILPQTAVSDITAAYDKRTTCIQTSATSYTIGHCRYLPQAGTNRPIVPLASDDPVAFAAYTQYQTDIQAIQTAYAAPLSRATQNSSFPAGGSLTGGLTLTQAQQQAIIEAARKADLANATQKYLASVCPGFYAQTSSGAVTDPSSEYKLWSVSTSASAPTPAGNAKNFWAPGVTDASIMTWALGAGVVGLSGPVLSVTIQSGGIGSGYTGVPTVAFNGGGGTGATGTATVSGGKITGVTVTSGGSGYTTNPTITFTSGGGTTTAADLASIVVQVSTSLSASAALIASGTFTPTSGSAVTYSANKYLAGTGDNVNWRVAYKNGPGTYPRKTYAP